MSHDKGQDVYFNGLRIEKPYSLISVMLTRKLLYQDCLDMVLCHHQSR